MADITMCTNDKCPLRCYRKLANPNPFRQSYCRFDYDEATNSCDHHYPISPSSNGAGSEPSEPLRPNE